MDFSRQANPSALLSALSALTFRHCGQPAQQFEQGQIYGTTARPIVFASVPNQSACVGAW